MSTVATAWKHGRVRCADAVHARLFDEELIILDLAKGEYFALDRVGARLWSGLDSGRMLEEIARELVEEYNVTLDRALVDLTTLGDHLVAQGLMVADESAGSSDDR
jgi:hypothetical protein